MSDVSTDAPEHEDLAKLRAKAGEADTANARAQAAERKLALMQAGVDLSTPLGTMFSDAYKGELNEEAIRAAAQEVGALKATTPAIPPESTGQPADPNALPAKREQTYDPVEAAVQTLARGGVQTPLATGAREPEPDPDPIMAAYERFTTSVEAGRDRESAATHVIFGIMDAAAKGDERVLYDPVRDRDVEHKRHPRLPATGMGL